MKILSIGPDELVALRDSNVDYLIVESQPYGNSDEQAYHIVVNDDTSKKLESENFLRVIADKGRTIGFWQNLGAGGIFRPDLVSTILTGFTTALCELLSQRKAAEIRIEGNTWQEIIQNSTLHDDVKVKLGVSENDVVADAPAKPRSRGRRKSKSESNDK